MKYLNSQHLHLVSGAGRNPNLQPDGCLKYPSSRPQVTNDDSYLRVNTHHAGGTSVVRVEGGLQKGDVSVGGFVQGTTTGGGTQGGIN